MKQKDLVPITLTQESKLDEVDKNKLEEKYKSNDASSEIESELHLTK